MSPVGAPAFDTQVGGCFATTEAYPYLTSNQPPVPLHPRRRFKMKPATCAGWVGGAPNGPRDIIPLRV
jgi:hypothetical protein